MMKFVKQVMLLVGLVFSTVVFGAEQCFEATPQNMMKFDWPRTAQVAVVETVNKGQHEVELKYNLNIKPFDQKLKIRFSDMEVTKFNGLDAKDPSIVNQVLSLKMMSLMVPEFVVSVKGEFIDIDMGAMVINRIIAAMPQQPASGAPSLNQIRDTLSNPKMQGIYKTKVELMWRAMVGNWLMFPNVADKKYQCLGETVFYAKSLPADEFYQQWPDHSKDQVKLSMTSKVQQASAKSLVDSMFMTLPADKKPVIESVKQMLNIELITQPSSLKPMSVSTETISQVKFKGRPANTKIEQHRYQFSW